MKHLQRIAFGIILFGLLMMISIGIAMLAMHPNTIIVTLVVLILIYALGYIYTEMFL